MAALVILAFFVGVIVLIVGGIKGFLAEKTANRALQKADILIRKLETVERKLERLERGVENLQSGEQTEQLGNEASDPQETPPLSVRSASDEFVAPISETSEVTADKVAKLPPELPKPSPETVEPPAQRQPPESARGQSASSSESNKIIRQVRERWVEHFAGMNWETFVGTYLIRIVGVVLVTVAVFFFLAQVARETGPGFRVFLGYCVSIGLLIAGKYTERGFPSYARVVYAGGLAIAYFVTFATHFIALSRIFESPLPSLGGMAIIVGIWAAIAQKRKSPAIALLVTVLGHFTIALATFNLPDPGIYAVFGVVLLSFGSAFFLLWNRWFYIAAVGMIASYANHFALLTQSTGSDTVAEFWIGMGVLTTYLLIFALAELFSHESLRRESIPSSIRSIFVALNTSCFFVLGTILVDAYTFTEEFQHVFRYALGAMMLAVGVLYYVRRGKDPLYNTYVTKASALATLGLASQFSGSALTTGLAIEMVVLLISSRRSGLVITRILAHVVAIITFAHGVFTFLELMDFVPYRDEAYLPTLIRALIPLIAFAVASQLYERTDWSTRMRLGLGIPNALRTLFWQLDLRNLDELDSGEVEKPFRGLFFPYAFSLAAAFLFLGYSLRLIDIDDRFNLYGLVGFGALLLAWILNTRAFAVSSVFYLGLAIVASIHTLMDDYMAVSFGAGVLFFGLSALVTEDKFVPYRDSIWLYRLPIAPYLMYGGIFWLIVAYAGYFFEDQHFVSALLALCIVTVATTVKLHTKAVTFVATAGLFCAHMIWHINVLDLGGILSNYDDQLAWSRSNFIALVMLTCLADRFTHRLRLSFYSPVYFFIVFTSSMHFIWIEAPAEWYGAFQAVVAFGYLGYGFAFWSKAAGGFAVLTAVVASLMQTAWAYDSNSSLVLPTVVGFVSVIALWILFERANSKLSVLRSTSAQPVIAGITISVTTLLALITLERIPQLSDLYLTVSWSLLAVVFFAVALVSTQKRYRYAGLAILSLATFRVVVYDTSALDATNRVLAYGGLGVVLLGLGFGYSKAFGKEDRAVEETAQEADTEGK